MDPTINLATVAELGGVLAIVPDSQAGACSSGIGNGGQTEPVIAVALDEEEEDENPDIVPPTQRRTKQGPVKGSSRKRKINSKNGVDTNTAPLYTADNNGDVSAEEPIYIPADLYQPLPGKVSIENLKKHATVSLILKNRAEAKFYDTMNGMLGHIKTAILKFNGVDEEEMAKADKNDHAYSSQMHID